MLCKSTKSLNFKTVIYSLKKLRSINNISVKYLPELTEINTTILLIVHRCFVK